MTALKYCGSCHECRVTVLFVSFKVLAEFTRFSCFMVLFFSFVDVDNYCCTCSYQSPPLSGVRMRRMRRLFLRSRGRLGILLVFVVVFVFASGLGDHFFEQSFDEFTWSANGADIAQEVGHGFTRFEAVEHWSTSCRVVSFSLNGGVWG